MEVLIAIIIALVFTVAYMAKRINDYSKASTLHSLVTWCVINSMDQYSHSLPLWAYINNAQIKFQIPQKYCISGDEEWSAAQEIIEEFRKDLIQSYFQDSLRPIKSKYAIPGEHYFMFALTTFLEEHQCDYEFIKHDMHKEQLEYKRYGNWGGPLYDATYSLTDFAVVYHKLYYIAYLCCKDSKIMNPNRDSYQNEEFLQEILDTKQIQISRY